MTNKFEPISVMELKKPQRKVFKVFLHCSASDRPEHDFPFVMEQWHKERGFNEIGYHFFIQKDGTICQGRSMEKIPAAQQGHNTGSIAICCHGLEKDKFTKEQRAALYALCYTLNGFYKGGLTFHGHCEVSNKTCPVFDYKEWLKLDFDGRMK